MLKKTLFATAALAMAATASNASIVSYSASVMEIAQPASVTDLAPGSNTHILAFNERQRMTLAADLVTDSGTIMAGTKIDSHMVLLNRDDTRTRNLTLAGSLVFSGNILGVISTTAGLLASDSLGAPSVYTSFPNRGLEAYNIDGYTVAGSALDVIFKVTQPGDWIRVVSVAEVPVPAAAAFLPMGFAALVGLRRRRKANKLA